MLIKVQNSAKLLFGCDPEFEAAYEKDGKLYALPPYFFRRKLQVPADETEDERHPIFIVGDDKSFKVHEDGANFEMAIRPSHNPKDLFDTVQEAMKVTSEQILSHFPEYCLPTLQTLPTINWEINRWKDMPDDFFMSTHFGCDPDEDVYEFEAEQREEDAKDHPFRYCGGHIHVSGNPAIRQDPLLAVKMMVITAGLAATAFSDVPDLERARVYRYGRPGKFRVQNYGSRNTFGPDYAIGIEYRTPSCRWAGDWNLAEKVLGWAQIGIGTLLGTDLGKKIHDEIMSPAIDAITTTNQPLALSLLNYVESKL